MPDPTPDRHVTGTQPIHITDMRSGDDPTPFRTLNEEWITTLFVLEHNDREVLGDPDGKILQGGGRIFLARVGEAIVGCVALIPFGNGIWELSKMAVSPHLRNAGLGRALMHHTLEQARAMRARQVFLGTSTRLPNAIHLYESFGFRHVPVADLPPIPYHRADVFMLLDVPQ